MTENLILTICKQVNSNISVRIFVSFCFVLSNLNKMPIQFSHYDFQKSGIIKMPEAFAIRWLL